MTNETPRKVALVFGGSRGIGAAAVRRLAQDGYAVAFTYVSSIEKAQALAAEIVAAGGDAAAIHADSADADAIRAAVANAVLQFGMLEAVIVNAGLFRTGLVDAVPLEDLDALITVNVRGVFLAIQASVPHLADGGRIITIGSNAAIRSGYPGTSVYQFTKAAVAAMVRGIALDLAPRRITVNNLQPGPTRTDITDGMADMLIENSPLKHVADPAEIAGAISYLCRDEASYVTGTSLTIDGGWVL